MTAYYNEVDPHAAQWLRNLIAAGEIASGDVDERSIEDVRPIDLLGYTQCHFFAGIGVWSRALRNAGWPDDRPVWTGSCPCQPFSAAGKRGGTADERHLWPHWFHLIQTAKPRDVPVFGEQVASKDGLAWLDLVHANLEGQGYAVGAVDLCAAGVGAPHIRQRLFFVAERQLDNAAEKGLPLRSGEAVSGRQACGIDQRPSDAGGMAYADGRDARSEGLQRGREHGQQPQARGAGGVAHAMPAGRPEGRPVAGGRSPAGGCSLSVTLGDANDSGLEGRELRGADSGGDRAGELAARASSPAGFWTDCDWLPCIDGKARPVEPGTFPLAHGVAGRVGRLRAYGNAIVEPAAREFIQAYLAG